MQNFLPFFAYLLRFYLTSSSSRAIISDAEYTHSWKTGSGVNPSAKSINLLRSNLPHDTPAPQRTASKALISCSICDGTIRTGNGRGAFVGRELRNKTVGVIGTGSIGSATIKLLLAFGCRILAYSRTERNEVKAAGVEYTSLDHLLQESDIVTLHIPLNQQTHHLINADKIALMKPTATLINTARGNICDIDAVASALKNNKIAGAAFDVFETEPPLPQAHPLLNTPNTICIPHIGYATREAFDIRADIVFDNVRKFIQM